LHIRWNLVLCDKAGICLLWRRLAEEILNVADDFDFDCLCLGSINNNFGIIIDFDD
jgi:hypothetical protein